MSKFAIYTDSRDAGGHHIKLARRIMKISLKRKVKVYAATPLAKQAIIELVDGLEVGLGFKPVPLPLNRANISYETTTAYEFLDDPAPHIADGKLYVALVDLPKTRMSQAVDQTLTHKLRTYICTQPWLVE